MKSLLLTGLAAALAVTLTGPASADEPQPKTFGTLAKTSPEVVQTRAMAWLKKATDNDADKFREAAALWAREDRSVLDNLADTFALGDPQAAELLKQVRDVKAPAPVGVPELLKNDKADPFFRANLGLAVARHLSMRRVHEEALAILSGISPEQTIDPATYLFTRAVCEHALMKKDDARASIDRLIRDVPDSPARYTEVAALMLVDMVTWKKDLGNIGRLMDSSGRRLELGRGGSQTQKIQKEIIARLDEMIKELEHKAKKKAIDPKGGGGEDDGGHCPEGGGKVIIGGGGKVGDPLPDSVIGGGDGTGKVDVARLKKLTDSWGKMPPGERARAMQEIQDMMQHMSPIHREAFERYFEEVNNQSVGGSQGKKG
jgi:hypothetical protein